MRLIDADKLHYNRIRMVHTDGNDLVIGGYNAVVMSAEIKDAPTVDAVPVVRYRDCKYYRPAERLGRKLPPDCGYFSVGKFLDTDLSPDDFCSRGERRTE